MFFQATPSQTHTCMRRLRTSPRTLCYCSGPLNSEDLKRLSTVDHLSLPLQALWHDAAGNWTRAHELCQAAGSPRVTGFTPTCTGRKATSPMPVIGIPGPAARPHCPTHLCLKNGLPSRRPCLRPARLNELKQEWPSPGTYISCAVRTARNGGH